MVEPQLLFGFNFIYTVLMDIITLSVVASDVFLRLSQSQTRTLRVGTIGAVLGSVLERRQSRFVELTFIFVLSLCITS